MAKLILHIGMPKTGSTAIQLSLFAGSGGDFIYPRLGKEPFKPQHTDALIQLFSSASGKIANNKRFLGKSLDWSDSDEQRIRQAAADAGRGSVILSSEGAYSYLTMEDIASLRRFAEQLFDDVLVVAYIREPFSLISANFHNLIKAKRLSKFTPIYKPYRRFENWDEVFGRSRVALWKYDPSTFPNGDVVQDFCIRLGLRAPSSAKVNETISRPAISAIYRLNRITRCDDRTTPAAKKARIALIRNFPHQNWPKFRLSPKIIKPIVESNAEDIAWIEDRIGSSLRNDQQAQDNDICCEADLLKINPRAIEPLSALREILPRSASQLLGQALEARASM